MATQVVRVTVPVVKQYDIVIEDGRPVFVGAVIPREASATGPDAGKIVDSHRPLWDARHGGSAENHFSNGRPFGQVGTLMAEALRIIQRDPTVGAERRLPAQLGRPPTNFTVGRPMKDPKSRRGW